MFGRILVTGGAGFIGSNFIRTVLRIQPDVFVVNLALLTYADSLENLISVYSQFTFLSMCMGRAS
jgi:dTDP-glucose 4,6-dehydratase